jgi:hypothetical protein
MNENEFVQLKNFIDRRLRFVERVADALPSRADGLALGQHCLKYHELVMHSFLKMRIDAFIQVKAKNHDESTVHHEKKLLLLTQKKDGDNKP